MHHDNATLSLPDRLPLHRAAATLGVALNTANKIGERGEFRIFQIGSRRFADRDSFVAYVARIRGETGAAAAA